MGNRNIKRNTNTRHETATVGGFGYVVTTNLTLCYIVDALAITTAVTATATATARAGAATAVT